MISIERCSLEVALRKESVDRNTIISQTVSEIIGVALRKESVDRNEQLALKTMKNTESLSARRAWIEIECAVAGC